MPSALTLSAQRRRNFAIMAGAPAGQSKRSKEWSRALDETLIGLLLERYPSGRVSSSDVGAIPWDAIFASDKFPPHLTAEKMRQRLHDAYAAWLSQAVRSPLAPPRLAGNSAHDALQGSPIAKQGLNLLLLQELQQARDYRGKDDAISMTLSASASPISFRRR